MQPSWQRMTCLNGSSAAWIHRIWCLRLGEKARGQQEPPRWRQGSVISRDKTFTLEGEQAIYCAHRNTETPTLQSLVTKLMHNCIILRMCVCVCFPYQGHGWRRRSRSFISDRLQQLTLEQKLYVAKREITETQQEREKVRQRYEMIQDSYKVTTQHMKTQQT